MEQELILAESLRQRGLDAQTKSIEGIFEFAACMVELKQNSEAKQGGSTFSKEASEWWGVGKSQISKWVAIGENILFRTTKQLPPSMESIYNLTTLSDEDFNAGVADGWTEWVKKELNSSFGEWIKWVNGNSELPFETEAQASKYMKLGQNDS